MRKIRILYTIPNFDTAGSGKALLNIALRLDREIFEPHILCLHRKGAFFKVVEESGIPIHVFDYLPKERPFIRMFRECWSVSRKLKAINPDLMHSFHYSANYTEALAAKLALIPWVFTKKNMSWGGSSANSWKFRSFFAKKIAVQNTDMIKKFYAKSKKIFLIPRGVVVANFKESIAKPTIKVEMETGIDHRILICVANFIPVKGLEVLVTAFSKIEKDHPNWVLWLIGENKNEYGAVIQELVAKLKLKGKVVFAGKKMNVIDYLNHAEIFILPTLEKGEGTPVAMLEAMANSKAVLGSCVPGISDQLEGFENHLFIPNNASDLAHKMNLLMQKSPGELKEIGTTFYKLVSVNYAIEVEVKTHEDFYLQVLNRSEVNTQIPNRN